MISIRLAFKNDAALIAKLSQQTFIETFAADNTKENMKQFLEESFSNEILMKEVGVPRNIFLLAFDDEEPVGYAKLIDGKNRIDLSVEKSIEISRIYILQKYIGTGVGKLMMKECIKIAIEKKKILSGWVFGSIIKKPLTFIINGGFRNSQLIYLN